MKFKVSVDYIEHYQELEVEADNAEEAKEKYLEKVEYGDVLSVNGDYLNLKAEKTKGKVGIDKVE